MADIEEIKKDVDKLKEKVAEIEINITKSLGEIKSDLTEIKTWMKNNTQNDDLKNELIIKDVKAEAEKLKALEERVNNLEDSNKWLIRLIIGSIVGLILEAIAFYLKTK